MPAPLLIAAGITAGSQIIGQNNANKQNKNQSKQQRRWNQEQWAREASYGDYQSKLKRQWDTDMWNKNNAYNTPAAQMQRYKDAGLNPHLIYGRGTPGNANAPTTQAPSTPNTKPYQKPEIRNITDGVNAFGDYQQLKNLQAQTDNVRSNTEVNAQTSLLLAEKTVNEATSGQQKAMDYQISKELRDVQITAAETNLQNLLNKTRTSGVEANLAEKTMPIKYQKAKQELDNLRKQGTSLALTNSIKKWEKELSQDGLSKTDNVFLRYITNLKNQFLPSNKSIIKNWKK